MPSATPTIYIVAGPNGSGKSTLRINLYDLPDPLPDAEEFTDLIPDRGVKIERIVSRGQMSPGEWYDQDRDEWVVLIQGEAVLEYEDGGTQQLGAGDHVLIPAHRRHRVNYTSRTPPCIWIAVFGELRGV